MGRLLASWGAKKKTRTGHGASPRAAPRALASAATVRHAPTARRSPGAPPCASGTASSAPRPPQGSRGSAGSSTARSAASAATSSAVLNRRRSPATWR